MCSLAAALNESLISDTNRERLVFCYSVRWYELFFEIAAHCCATDSPRNHVVCLAILFSCQRTDFRRRAARLPDPPVRVKRNVSTLYAKDIPSDADTGNYCRFRKELAAESQRKDQGVYVGPAALSSIASGTVTTSSPHPLFHRFCLVRRTSGRRSSLHKLLCTQEVTARFSKIRSRVGTPDNGVGVGPIPRSAGTTRRGPKRPKRPPRPPRRSSTAGSGPRPSTSPSARRSPETPRSCGRARPDAHR